MVLVFLYFVFYSLYLILGQLTLLSLVVYGSTVSAPCCLVVLFHSKCFLMLFCLISLHYVNGINKVMMMMMMMKNGGQIVRTGTIQKPLVYDRFVNALFLFVSVYSSAKVIFLLKKARWRCSKVLLSNIAFACYCVWSPFTSFQDFFHWCVWKQWQESSRSRTRRTWRDCGAGARTVLRWTMTSWVGRYDSITARASSARLTALDDSSTSSVPSTSDTWSSRTHYRTFGPKFTNTLSRSWSVLTPGYTWMLQKAFMSAINVFIADKL